MSLSITDYEPVIGPGPLMHLRRLGEMLKDRSVVHLNSTRVGGGVAEILENFVPLMRELGIDARWEVITGTEDFFKATKLIHNSLQGAEQDLSPTMKEVFMETNRENAQRLAGLLEEADFVVIHDPQPAPLLSMIPQRRGKWIWRCHIDVSRPNRSVWNFIKGLVGRYHASVFSLVDFAQPLPHPQYIIPPGIDPLSYKNRDLSDQELNRVYEEFNLDPTRPIITQISRYDRFKDPVGVIRAYRMAKAYHENLQLVLAGGDATDDPEGALVLRETLEAAGDDPDIHVLSLPSDAHLTINALQRISHVILQKSTREGFGLTVSEGLWKRKPVIGGDTGGIRLQVIDYHTGFRVRSPEGAALRIRQLLQDPRMMRSMGEAGHSHVRDHFLITRQLRNLMTTLACLQMEETGVTA
ncbi:glycosyl transferase group 1 [Thermanaerovibrio acidaminovorans DSM 6589]|uniref:Glycosyl transferase group 1 n=1 Tax=Thermanaerovibrio acidaminovorans (strain ATCC 49978 / DSM 6589 / Su883) TaxID=525903 RepID=D1B8D1_THEAS|nr:glycosyltransferase [Thermanaerovibrio acidaminovorans]ACZ18534.1 glycosyl transferase group 1 [Thermanaerovibrio acidaminovorans DSM 6589]